MTKVGLTKEELEGWDDRIVRAIQDLHRTSPSTGLVTFKKVCEHLGVDPHGKNDDDFRVVDRRLQAMRKKGLVVFDGRQWQLLPIQGPL